MKSILLTIFFFATIATAKCETAGTVKTDVKVATPTTQDATAKAVLVGTNDQSLKLIREGVKAA